MSQVHSVTHLPVHSDSQQENAARSVGKRYTGLQCAVRRREIALELKRLAFGPTEEGDQVHNSAFCSEALRRIDLPSRRILALEQRSESGPIGVSPKGCIWIEVKNRIDI
jgi:hypothetical protein